MSEYREILRRSAATSDAAFAEYVANVEFPGHLREAERFANRHSSAVILMPRGHAKTELFIKRTARLVGATRGRVRLGILAAVQDDAEARSAAVRTIVESGQFAEVFPWAAAGVRSSDWSDGRWTIGGAEAALGKDSTCRAMGLASVRAGARLDILLADDMVGFQENATEAMRRKVSTLYWSVVDPMVVPHSPALAAAIADHPGLAFPVAGDGSVPGVRWFLGTRWHEDDLYAELMRKGVPSLLRAASAADGSVLWPGYWSVEKLAARRADLGTPLYNLQFQNEPEGMGGNIFRRDWFHYVDALPPGTTRSAGMDLASGAKETNDFTALGEVATDANGNLYVVGSYADRLAASHRQWLTGLRDGLPDAIGTESPRLLWPLSILPPGFAGATGAPEAPRSLARLNVEATAYQSTFVRELQAATRLPAVAVYPDKDKVSRARSLAARYEAGTVFHLRGAPGLDAYEHDAVAFPNGQHDDRIDAMVYAADLNPANEFSFAGQSRYLRA